MINELHVSKSDEFEILKMFTIEPGMNISSPEVQRAAIQRLEGGGLELSERERELISNMANILTQVPDVENGKPTIPFDLERGQIKKYRYVQIHGKMLRAQVKDTVPSDPEAMMARYRQWIESVITKLFPSFRPVFDRKRATYRPFPRNSTQALHIDSSYGYPTQGCRMLRVFTNINPVNRLCIWQLGEPFESFVRRFLPDVHVSGQSRFSTLLTRLGIVDGVKTKYYQYIAALRSIDMRDKEYQASVPRKLIEFPAGTSWIAITGLVLHGAISGQHSLDQTFYLPVEAMSDPSRSPLRILERLTGEVLA